MGGKSEDGVKLSVKLQAGGEPTCLHVLRNYPHLSKFHIYALVYCIGVFLSGLLHSV